MTTRLLAIALLTTCLASPAATADTMSGNHYLPHCQRLLRGVNAFFTGACLGQVTGDRRRAAHPAARVALVHAGQRDARAGRPRGGPVDGEQP
jgi:hypothetical protein